MYNRKLTIKRTRNQDKIAACAQMMAATDPWITLGLDFGQCLKAFEGKCKEIYVAVYGREVAGFVILQVCGTFSGYIQTICISEQYRGKGLGRQLLQFCEDRVLEFSPNLFICVSSFNTRAAKLYYDFGFRLVGEMENFVRNGYSELLLRKTFGQRTGYIPIKKHSI